MSDQSWPKNVVQVSERYEEKYPSGKRNYEMIGFGPVIETCFVYLPENANDQEREELIMERHRELWNRCYKSVVEQVNQAIKDKRLIGVNER